VSLASSDAAEAAVPASVTIPAGETSVIFPITIPDDAELDGTKAVLITASAPDCASAPVVITVQDNETPAPTLSPYEIWLATHGLGAVSAEPTADFDEDGVANLLEWAFGTPPDSSSPTALSIDDGYLTARGKPVALLLEDGLGGVRRVAAFCRRKDHVALRLTYSVAFSGDLAAWDFSTATPTVLADDGEIEIVAVPFPAPVNDQSTDFFRVSVSIP
jgi:hypothetical protein